MNTVEQFLELNSKIQDMKVKLGDKTITVAEYESLKGELAALQKDFDSLAQTQYNEYLKFARTNKELFKNWNIPYLRSVRIDSFKIKKSKNAILVKAFNAWDGVYSPFHILIPFEFIFDKDAYLVTRTEHVKESMLKKQEQKLIELRKKQRSIISQIEITESEISDFDSFFEEKMKEYRETPSF